MCGMLFAIYNLWNPRGFRAIRVLGFSDASAATIQTKVQTMAPKNPPINESNP